MGGGAAAGEAGVKTYGAPYIPHGRALTDGLSM